MLGSLIWLSSCFPHSVCILTIHDTLITIYSQLLLTYEISQIFFLSLKFITNLLFLLSSNGMCFLLSIVSFTALFPMKKVGATDCSGICSPFEMPPCRSSDCRCIPIVLVGGYCINPISPAATKMVEEHPNLCHSHTDCTKKGSGSFCARYPNPDIEYGWCFDSNSEAQDVFFKIYSNFEFIKDFVKMSAIA